MPQSVPIFFLAGALLLLASPGTAQTCVGDCNADGEVTVDELVTSVSIALGTRDLTDCPSIDGNGDSQATVDEVVSALNSGLTGCAAGPICDPLPVPDDATGIIGLQEDGTFLGHNGRLAGGIGDSVIMDATAQAFVMHPTLPLAYVSSYGRDGRKLQVVDIETFEVIQERNNIDPQGGPAITPDGTQLFVPLGTQRQVVVVDIEPDGSTSNQRSIDVGERVVALHVSADGSTLWAGLFTEREVVAIDLPSLEERARISLTQGAWDIIEIDERNELYVSDLAGRSISVIDTTTDSVAERIEITSSPARMARNADGSVVWVAVSGSDFVVAIDTATRTVEGTALVAENDIVDEEGVPLPHSNANAVAFEPVTNRLFVTRGSDNAVTVLDADSLEFLGSMPTLWWPTDISFSAAIPGRLVVSEGHGGGLDPEPEDNGGNSNINNGSLTMIDLSTIDLAVTTERVVQNQRSSLDRYPFDCPGGTFPIPTRPGQVSPIEHVILVVKENKTFDTIFGDLGLPGMDGEPSLVRWGADIVPNHRKLAQNFNISDRFFLEAQESDSGHIFLTAGHMTEFVQRFWSESAGSLGATWPVLDAATPDQGNIFTHLMDHGRSIQIYGEIVGANARAASGLRPIQFSDRSYPGGPITTYAVLDRDRGEHVVQKARENGLADFTYVLIPNDHTEGSTPGRPTPESHVADNDEGLGIIVDGISKIPELWRKTAIFILEDDPQGSGDHVSKARSFLIVASPWARRDGYVSHHQISFLSVHATMLRILGVPPLGRQIASAAPLWDLFTEAPDFRPYDREQRRWPVEFNGENEFGAAASMLMDFRSPDRNPDLGRLLGIYREYKMGRITRAQAEEKWAEPMDSEEYEDLLEEAVEDTTAWEMDFAAYNAWLAKQGETCLPDGRIVPLEAK